MKLRHLDLFSGIGGFSLGLEATGGFETVAFCEIEEFPRQVLQKHWPHVKQYKDIKELTYDKLKADGIDSIDIITGGYPCQPFSVAGKQKGVEDPRHLWPEYFRLVKECRPTWVIGENVSGHIKLGLDSVIEDLESENYSVRPFSISSSSIGANHQRERIWILAYSERNYNFNEKQRVNGEEKEISREHREDDSMPWKSSRTSESRIQSDSHVEDTRQHIRGIKSSGNTEGFGSRAPEKTEWSTNSGTTTGSSKGTETLANTKGSSRHVHEADAGDGKLEAQEVFGDGSGLSGESSWWAVEPDVGRVAHGIPERVDRLKSLGNSLVPQIPYYIGQTILEVMNAEID